MSVALRYKNSEDDAAYLANEGFIKVLSNIDKINSSKSIVPWMKRIMVNTAIDDFRKNKKYGRFLFY